MTSITTSYLEGYPSRELLRKCIRISPWDFSNALFSYFLLLYLLQLISIVFLLVITVLYLNSDIQSTTQFCIFIAKSCLNVLYIPIYPFVTYVLFCICNICLSYMDFAVCFALFVTLFDFFLVFCFNFPLPSFNGTVYIVKPTSGLLLLHLRVQCVVL